MIDAWNKIENAVRAKAIIHRGFREKAERILAPLVVRLRILTDRIIAVETR